MLTTRRQRPRETDVLEEVREVEPIPSGRLILLAGQKKLRDITNWTQILAYHSSALTLNFFTSTKNMAPTLLRLQNSRTLKALLRTVHGPFSITTTQFWETLQYTASHVYMHPLFYTTMQQIPYLNINNNKIPSRVAAVNMYISRNNVQKQSQNFPNPTEHLNIFHDFSRTSKDQWVPWIDWARFNVPPNTL